MSYDWFPCAALVTKDGRPLPTEERVRTYLCSYCNTMVTSISSITTKSTPAAAVHACPGCGKATFFDRDGTQVPAPKLGRDIARLADGVKHTYEEARICTQHACYTASVMLCRKLLMSIAVENGAKEGRPFIEYVNRLKQEGLVPPRAGRMLDRVRQLGNEANHSVVPKSKADAELILEFLAAVLMLNYEYADPPADESEHASLSGQD